MSVMFHPLTHSDLTQRVGLTLAHALWQGLVAALLLGVILRWMRSAAASTRHAVACGALLVALVAPMVTFYHLGRSLPPIEDAPVGALRREPDFFQGDRDGHQPSLRSGRIVLRAEDGAGADVHGIGSPMAIPWHAWAVALWLAGMTALTLWHGIGLMQLQRLRRCGVSAWTDAFAVLAGRLAKRLGLHAVPCVLWSTRIGGPVAFGCWRAVVLMPASMATGFTMAQIEMILAHEFAHLRRHDYFINLCQTLATTLLFFHPAVWWIDHVIRREREYACDDMAVAAVGDAKGYARALVSLAEQEFTSAPTLATAAMRGKSSLRRRIERLLYPLPCQPALRFWPGLATLVFAIIAWQALPSESSAVRGAAPDTAEAPVRGDIRDRNGVMLATNDKEDVQIWFRLRDVGIAYAEAHGGTFPLRKRESYKITWAVNVRPWLEEREFPDIAAMFNELVIPMLEEASLPQSSDPEHEKISITRNNHAALVQPYNSTALKRSYEGDEGLPAVVTPEQARSVLSRYGSELWCYSSKLTPEQEKRARAIAGRVPGMSVHIKKSRRYPFGALASHVLGYVNQSDLESRPVKPNDYGVYGVEKTQDNVLQSSVAKGDEGPGRGSDVYLSLDARHQTVVEQTLRDATPAIGRASVVLTEINTGDVLAMASVPSFDPNDFIPSISREKFDEYNANETRPMLNRAVRDFTPGSTFFMATSLAAICSGHEDDRFDCTGGITYGNKYMQCWIGQKGGSHGTLGLREAIVAGCGPYFFQLGNSAGNDALETIGDLCGLGRKTGVGLDEEVSGILPTKSWWMANRPKDPFSAATIANISIGQGAVETTPLQLASLTATVANGGTVWKPRLVDRIAPHGDASKAEVQPRVRTADLREHGLTEGGLAALRGAMEDVVHSPEARAKAAQSAAIRIAGLTGTAQNWRIVDKEAVKDNHTWFVCYAPAEKPKWALAVIVQGGKGGGVSAAPIARRILEQVSEIEAGTLKVEPKAMAPAKGNFDMVEEVVLPPWK